MIRLNGQRLLVAVKPRDLYGIDEVFHIQQQLIEHGREINTPIAIIERGTKLNKKCLLNLIRVSEPAEYAQSPSLIVIGEVVSLSSKLFGFLSSQQNSTQPIAI